MTTAKIAIVAFALIVTSSRLFAQSADPLTFQRCMTPEEFRGSGLHQLSAFEMRALNAWFNKPIDKAIALGREANRANAAKAEDTIADIVNATIIAADGQFLGNISDSAVDSKAISNQVRRYGGVVGRFSIFNEVGRYGGEVGTYSPFNAVSSRPPQISIDGKPVCYLTVNPLKSPRFDPRALKAWVESRR